MSWKRVLGKLCLSLLGKVCLLVRSGAGQEQVIQHFLFLPFLPQLVGVMLPLSKFAEDLAIPARVLIDGQLGQALCFELSKAHAQPIRRHFQLRLPFSNIHKMRSGQFEGEIFFPLSPNADLFLAYLPQFLLRLDDLLNDEQQGGLFRMLDAFAKAQHRVESKTECHG